MSSERRRFVGVLLVAAACADVRRGAYWDEPTETSTGDGDTTTTAAGTSSETTADASGSDTGSSSGGITGPAFASDIAPLLDAGCARCHSADGEANDTALVLVGEADADYEMTLEFVDLDAPASSRLLTKGAGKGHVGGVVFDDRSAEYETILTWIENGATP